MSNIEAAKAEWIKHICNLLVPIIEEGFRNIYANCVSMAMSSSRPESQDDDMIDESVISFFQQTLRDIPKWNAQIVETEFNRILESDPDCKEILDDLIKAAFTSYIIAFTKSKMDIPLPSSKRFVHKVYIESARVFFRNPHLFYAANSEYQNHKNNARIEAVLCSSVEESVRKLLPLQMILGKVPTENDIDPNEVEDITRRFSPRSRRGLKGVLKTYIETAALPIVQLEQPPRMTIQKVPNGPNEVDLSDIPNEDDLDFDVLIDSNAAMKKKTTRTDSDTESYHSRSPSPKHKQSSSSSRSSSPDEKHRRRQPSHPTDLLKRPKSIEFRIERDEDERDDLEKRDLRRENEKPKKQVTYGGTKREIYERPRESDWDNNDRDRDNKDRDNRDNKDRDRKYRDRDYRENKERDYREKKDRPMAAERKR